MRIAYLDCFAGISGDMFLGALLDAGVPARVLEEAVAALGLDASLRVETVDRSGISSTKVHVLEHGKLAEAGLHEPGHEHSHAHEHGPEHTHESNHKHSRDHKHDHGHEHGHSHEHKHSHSHADHEHGHDHEHKHEHGHKHDGKHGEAPHVHGRSLTAIRELITAAPIPEPVKRRAIRTFELLGHSEAKIHNVPVEQIHFHEVGAVDAIVDIVASCAGIEYLGAEGPLVWRASPVNVGGGMVACAHGLFPVPAPATADLLRGMPTYSAHLQKELVTPTGAALLRTLDPEFGSQPPMSVERIGYGAGTRNPHGFPNVLRLNLGSATEAGHLNREQPEHSHEGDTVTVLETALDDTTPQVLAHVAERALAGGALDVMLTPVLMKKGRPGTLITLLANPADVPAMETLLLRETTTLGVRRRKERRSCLARQHTPVETPYGEVRIKTGTRDGEEWNAAPEFEDCRAAAARHGVPLKQVMQAALAAYSLCPAV